MTAKHRRGKNNHKHEDNFFKNDISETEVRGGANNYALHLVLFLLIVVCGAIGAWFCIQQHQTLTYLTDNLMGMQMKIVKLQSSHEELRQSSSKPLSDSLETRLIALEESYALAQKQVGMALATAEQLRTSDLPAQVLSLHTEMKTRLAEMQQATVSLEQLSQLQSMLKGKSEEFDGVRIQVEGLATLSSELSEKVEVLTGTLGEAESKLEKKEEQVGTLTATLDGQAAEVLRLKEQLVTYEAQLEASTKEMAAVRELLASEQSQRLQQASVEEQLNTVRQSLQDQNSAAHSLHSGLRAQLEIIQKQVTKLVEEAQPAAEPEQAEEEAAPAADEEAAPAADEEAAAATEDEAVEEEAAPADEAASPEEVEVEKEQEEAEADEGAGAAAPEEAPVEQEDTVTDEAAPSDEAEADTGDQTEQAESESVSEKEEEETIQTEEGEQGVEEEASEGEEVQEEAIAEEDVLEEEEEEQQEVAAEEEAEEDEESLETNDSPEDEYTGMLTTQQTFGQNKSYLTPVRDEEAESQRKAKSRHARQTRRSTQGVTLTELKEAQKTFSLSPQDRQIEEAGTLDERFCLRTTLTDDRRVRTGLTESEDTTEISPKWSKMDEQGNLEPRLETLAECPISSLSYSSNAGSCGLLYCSNTYRVGDRWRRDENQNPVEETAPSGFATKHQQRRRCCAVEGSGYNTAEHERLSRYDSSGESATDKPLGRTSSYSRRETRLGALNRQEQDSTTKDYKKMYAEALHENERLKSRLQDSKQELVRIRSQLEKVTQRHDRISERSSALDSEKREKQALEKRVSNMEEDLKILTELKSDNQRLKDENGALIRVISKLSK